MVTLRETARRGLTRLTHKIHTRPVVVLMPHGRCNCRCLMCDIWKANANYSEISTEQLEAHLDVFERWGVRQVVLSGGEALMHSDLWRLCEALARRNISITLLSTGLLIAKNAEATLRWCDEVIVSLDGGRQVHDAIRDVPRAFDRLAEGVAALKSLDAGYRVTGRSVVQRRNHLELPDIVDSARAIGLDQISFLAVDVSTPAFNRALMWQQERVSDVALSASEVAALRASIETMIRERRGDFDTGFIAESPDKLLRIPQYFAALNGREDFPPVTCNAPWVSAVIEADGAVRPCFFHPSLGNIHEQGFDEILNSEAAINFRRGLDVQADPLCKKCVCTLSLSPRA